MNVNHDKTSAIHSTFMFIHISTWCYQTRPKKCIWN